MEIIKKIGFFISEPRQIDYYSNILRSISNELLVIIINDFGYNESSEEYKKIKNFCVENDYSYLSATDLKKKDQKILLVVGTGNTSYHVEKTSISTSLFRIIKFFYAKTLGIFIERTQMNILFKRLFNRNLTLGGQNAELILVNEIPPEAILGHKKLLFPRGMDIYYNHPGPMRKKNFDYFFSISKFDDDYIKKNSNKKSFIIGYPRYSEINNNKIDTDLEKKIDKNKKTILWITSDMIVKKLKNKNIYTWLTHVSNLTKKYNVILRPHPNSLKNDNDLINQIQKTNLILDNFESRNLKKLYDFCHLVLADYGGPIFSALYCKKNILLLNTKVGLKKKFKFDLMVRDDLCNIDIDLMNTKSLEQIIDNELKLKEIKDKTLLLRQKIFPVHSNIVEFNKIIYKIFEKENKFIQ